MGESLVGSDHGSCGPRYSSKGIDGIAPSSFISFQGCVTDGLHPGRQSTCQEVNDSNSIESYHLGSGRESLPEVNVTRDIVTGSSGSLVGTDVTDKDGASIDVDFVIQYGTELQDEEQSQDVTGRSDNCSYLPRTYSDSTVEFSVDGNTVNLGDSTFVRPCGSACVGTHFLSGCRLQLNPCVFFRECFEHESGVDPNAEYIFSGVLNGFDIVDEDFTGSYFCDNYDSILRPGVKTEMDRVVREELSSDKLSLVDNRPTCIHSLGAVAKGDGSLRPITDCKRPIGYSINNFMNEVFDQFQFIKIDDVCDVITEGCFFSVLDIKSAYRSVNINPDHRKFQGLMWDVDGVYRYLHDNCLSFGLKCAPWIFSRLSEFVVRCMRRRGHNKIFSYLDDFLVVGDSRDECLAATEVLMSLLRELGFFIAWKKVVSATTRVVYLGIQIDSVLMEISLPESKLIKISKMVAEFRSKDKCTKRQLEQLAGNLAHASTVVKGGRTFSRRVINVVKYLPDRTHMYYIPSWMKLDLEWWHSFMQTFNGKAKVITGDVDSEISFGTDSSMTGFAAVWQSDWVLGVWGTTHPRTDISVPLHHLDCPPIENEGCSDINVLELWPVLAAVGRWGTDWKDRKVRLWTDNTQVLHMIMTGRSRSVRCMSWIRELFWRCAIYNIQLVASHIATGDNVVPDYFSRLFDVKRRGYIQYELLSNLCCYRDGWVEAEGSRVPGTLDGRLVIQDEEITMEDVS